MYVSWDRFIGDTMEKLFALAIVMVIVTFAVVYTIAALNAPSTVKSSQARHPTNRGGGVSYR